MNFMRKIVGQGGGASSQETAPDNTLGLMHLRKLFADFRHPIAGTSQRELEDKLYNMLPLFCKVFGASPSADMTEKFPDILQFCSHVSRLMVSEIRRRASNQSTDAASCSIVRFLEIESTEELSKGWMLLSTLNLLCAGPSSIVDCMTAASLPSTLVKCLYLFFDLPDVQHADVLEPGCEFTPRERRVLLQKVFVQILVRLCSHSSPAEELARKDDLTLLFSAITSWCPPHNVPWRKSAAEVLMTLSRHGLTPNVVQYIHSKGCVNLCIDNMQRVQELSPIELVEMFVTVFCFLKDSSEVSQMLLDDFRSCQGYMFLSDFLLKMEVDVTEEAVQALRNLVLLVGSLTTCGYIELKPSANSAGSLFQMPGFSVPQPAGKGVSVRNLQAFQVLQTVFLKSNSGHLLSTILDVISSIYHQDNANYFILEPQNTLSQFAERIHIKPKDIQAKFLDILDFVVFNLNFVPCKELISLSILIKTNQCVQCSILCMNALHRILRCHSSYKDVYREVGLLEVFVTCLHRYAALLKDPQNETEATGEGIADLEQEMGALTMEILTQLLNSNNSNAAVFRECGGARCAHNMVPYAVCRQQALGIVQQLVLSAGGDDDMGTLLGLMHTAPTTALELKTHVLKSLLHVLRESHRTRTVFRKVGGFVYVMSVLVSMEGCLSDPPKGPWSQADRSDVVILLKTVFNTLTVAMRYEPANARFFATEVRYASLTEAVRLLGCFGVDVDIQRVPSCAQNLKPREESPFSSLFCSILKDPTALCDDIPPCLVSATRMLRYLYDMALDNLDKPVITNETAEVSPNMKRISSVFESSSNPHESLTPLAAVQKRASTGSLCLSLNSANSPEPVIVHAGAVISMLHLVPGLRGSGEHPLLSLELQLHTCDVIKSLVRTERNQQVMCEAGLPHELLTHATVTLSDETHPLHTPLQYVFERLAAQSLTPKDLRDFLRLGNPLCCAMEDEDLHDARREVDQTAIGPTYAIQEKFLERPKSVSDIQPCRRNGGPVPLTRVKCLVSMTTPRDVRLHGASITPGFVEFDMSAEGFGCLYLPSIAPQGPPTPSVVGAGMIGGSDPGVIGGIGSGERVFPPQSGFSFSSWICVDKFSAPKTDPHPVRLATLVRNIQGREENLVCMRVFLSARDRSLIVSTREMHMPPAGSPEVDMEPELNDTTVRFWCPELTQEGQWRHLMLLFHKAGIMKNSSVSLYIDGTQVSTQKLHYVSPNLGGGGTVSPNSSVSVFAFLGTPPQLRRQSKLLWRQGPCQLLEDVVSPNVISFLYNLGPNYIGSFQAANNDGADNQNPLIAEEKIVFGVFAHAMSLMTVAKIRKIYNKFDAKSIAKQLGMSAHENATPIRILHNSAGHLSGSARTFGAIIMGYLGVRTFCPKPVAKMIMNTGGTSALLGLIAMAVDVEGIYAAVKALVCVVRSNKMTMREMDRTKGYQTLAMLFKRKRHLLNSHILHLTFSLVGTVDSGRETTIIPNQSAFEDLLCDLEVWHEAPGDLQRSLYEHFFELLTESSEQKFNVCFMQDLGLVDRLLRILRDTSLSRLTLQMILSTVTVLLSAASHPPSLLHFGQFLVSLLPPNSLNEKSLSLNDCGKKNGTEGDVLFDATGNAHVYNIKLRNACLEVIAKLLKAEPTAQGMNLHFCDEMLRILGYDWLLLFMQSNLHCTTVVMTMRILLLLLGNQSSMQKFRDGGAGGGWLDETESVLQNRVGVLLGFNVGSSNSKGAQKRELSTDASHIPGFCVLQWLLPKHTEISELYFLLLALLLAQPVKELPDKVEFDLDTVWTYIFGVRANQHVAMATVKARGELCGEAASCILSMIRAMLSANWEGEEEGSWVREYPVTLMQFLMFLYHNQTDVAPLFMTPDFICGLVSTLFKYRSTSEANSELTSPVEDFKPFPGSDSMVFVKTVEPRSGETSLSSHPAKKFVLDFLRMIIMDSLSMTQTIKAAGIIDLILEASPDQASNRQRREFQTCILNIIMEHLLAADILLGDEAAISIVSGGNYSHMANNVFYLCGRIVDKLWQGSYIKDPKEVFEFITKLICQAKRKASGLSLDVIYKCLNRTVLFQLSRPLLSTADQTNVLDALHRLTTNRGLVFGPGNYDQEFFGCLCYCLMQMTEDPLNISEPNVLRTTTWHVDAYENGGFDEAEEQMIRASLEAAANADGLQLLCTAAKRVWEELYICKKPCIEEVFKVSLGAANESTASPKITTPSLDSVRPTIQESATRVWLNYVENERKCVYSNSERMQSQLHSVSGKLQKVGQGVIRLATRKPKRESSVKAVYATSNECFTWTANHVDIVKDLVQFHYQQYLQSQQHMREFLLEEWECIEYGLLRERGLWGSPVGSELDKWQLDLTEGPYRMRKKMIRNTQFYSHYPYRPPNSLAKPSKYKMAASYDSQLYYERYRSKSLVAEEQGPLIDVTDGRPNEAIEEDDIFINEEADLAKGTPSLLHGLHAAKNTDTEDETDLDPSLPSDPTTENEASQGQEQDLVAGSSTKTTDNQTILRLLEEGEKISHMFRCARIQGLDTIEGLLLFGKEHYYVVDGFTLLRTKEIADIDSLPADLHDPIIPRTARGPASQKKMCYKFAFDGIREVHKRRYLLQPIAVEVFSADGRNFLLSFPRKIRNKVHARFLTVATAIRDSAQESVSGQKQSAKVEPGTGLISSLNFGEKSVTQRWERGEISNFEYLMCLNTLAGRSYNDLMQYPVFPWIVANYDDEEMDLNDPETFRDLSRPMGAQTPDRLKQFKKRFADWDDPTGETPPYHYGTHYSSAMIVASYLVRMEPFTQTFLKLQGGHFDLADRMFHSVKDAWTSASKHNMADVKELIPEFFYLPEFLLNSNNFDLGTKQSGVSLGDIVLPVWAKGDPREFIRAHREALECDYVSAHLHEWIDLMFGNKQQGPAAVEAVNVFHHLFYEGNVDIYSIEDPLKKNAVIGFINNFGQIPKQLFRKPHPQKRLSLRLMDTPSNPGFPCNPNDKLFFHNLDNLRPSMQPIKELRGAVGQIMHNDKVVLAVEQNKVLVPPICNKYLAWGFSDLSIRMGNYDSDKATAVFENIGNGEILCASCPDAKTIVTAGTSTVVHVWEFGKGKDRRLLGLKCPLYGHTEAVTCLATSAAYNLIVSGSRDRTCIIWDLSGLAFVRQLRGHAAPVAAVNINDVTGDIATCAGTYLHVWSINGDEIASINTATVRNQQILCVCMSQLMEWDSRNVIMTGNSDGVVRMWSLEFVEVADEPCRKSRDEASSSYKGEIPRVCKQSSADVTDSGEKSTAQRLAEFKDPEYLAAHAVEMGSSADSDAGMEAYERRRPLQGDCSTFSSSENLISFDDTPVDSAVDALDADIPAVDRQISSTSSNAVASPASDFEMVSDSDVKDALKTALHPLAKKTPQQQQRKLRDGFHWQKQLVFRSKLTMHTAFERKDNKDPAAVTALAVSKDHKTVYVGDAKGRVFCWSVTDQPGRVMADHWVKDEGGDSCVACHVKFSHFERRHHCRNCGQLFCSKCSRFETEIRRLRILKPVRVCQACYNILKAQQASDAMARNSSSTIAKSK